MASVVYTGVSNQFFCYNKYSGTCNQERHTVNDKSCEIRHKPTLKCSPANNRLYQNRTILKMT